jgi:hypothetical protein
VSAQKQSSKRNSRKVGRGNSKSWINSGGPYRCAMRKVRNVRKRWELHLRAMARLSPEFSRTQSRTAARMAAAENIYPLR